MRVPRKSRFYFGSLQTYLVGLSGTWQRFLHHVAPKPPKKLNVRLGGLHVYQFAHPLRTLPSSWWCHSKKWMFYIDRAPRARGSKLLWSLLVGSCPAVPFQLGWRLSPERPELGKGIKSPHGRNTTNSQPSSLRIIYQLVVTELRNWNACASPGHERLFC